MTEKVNYAELTPAEFRQRVAAAPIAYLPLGTLEWHGEHLPLGSDGLQSTGFFERLASEVGGIADGLLIRSDRDAHVYQDTPEALIGSEYIRTFNSDKGNAVGRLHRQRLFPLRASQHSRAAALGRFPLAHCSIDGCRALR